MLWVPQKGIIRVQHNVGGVGTFTPGTSVTTGGASSTKGTAVQLIASTSFDAYWVTVLASGYGSAGATSQGCLDILTGAATEEVLIPNLLMGFCGGGSVLGMAPKRWDFPLYIPAGSRLAAQAAGDRVSAGVIVAVFLYGGHGSPPFRVGSKVTTYGITTVPAGTDVTAGYTGTVGAWTQIAATTSENHFAFVPSFHPTDGDTSLGNQTMHMDLGFGAAAAEELLGGNVEQGYIFRYGTIETCDGPINSFPTFADLPSGSRLCARLSAAGGAGDSGEPDVAIHAVS